MTHTTQGSTSSSWRTMYRIGAWAAFIAVIVFRRNFSVEMVSFGGFGVWDAPAAYPAAAGEWFALFADDPLMGLVLYDLFDAINYILIALLFLAIYGALRHVNRALMAAATAFAWVGTAVYLASNRAFAMLALSQRYAAASSEATRASLSAAGEALLAAHHPGGRIQGVGILAALFLIVVAGLIVSLIMLRSDVFSRATGIIGLIANGMLLFHFIVVWLPVGPALLALPTAGSAPFRVTWYVLIALRLLRLAKRDQADQPLAPVGAG